ncbi:dienelactone hydrolase family protein [Kordiimonas marina]|uniref:dienelactone hydrolase family protein n=1 Tax=Kordiimonas marina TaxID=2872312 RepID=UPI001FF277DD|nr:dienelactone hydrolase family protein [Kordiimonas marina]MCJ9428227.1 dienelactone hydrolase family protein [Kordiimonas marina]
MRQDIIDLYDSFTHGTMGRRAFLKRLAFLAGGTAAAATLLPLLQNNYAAAAVIPEDDPRLKTGSVTLKLSTGPLMAYVADRADSPAEKRPTVLVIHENRGLNPHIKDVTRRVALAGFHAVAPDMLSPMGGTPADEDEARKMIYQLEDPHTVASLVAAVDHFASSGKVGAMGFCWGGGMVNQLAAHAPDLSAGVAYYGRQVSAEAASHIKAAMMLHYAGLDKRIGEGIDAYKAALQAAGVDYQLFIYDGVQHAFNNDTNAARYNKAAADLAWGRSMTFLKDKLG